jgi:hypothetical protein
VATYVALTFAISRAAVLAAGALLTGLVAGRTDRRELLARLLGWRVGAGWYAVALLTGPIAWAADRRPSPSRGRPASLRILGPVASVVLLSSGRPEGGET